MSRVLERLPPAGGFPRLYAAASLKHRGQGVVQLLRDKFSAALCRGLIEAGEGGGPVSPMAEGFPRLYAAASLKRRVTGSGDTLSRRFPRLYAAASLKRAVRARVKRNRVPVFRGSMPQPH